MLAVDDSFVTTRPLVCYTQKFIYTFDTTLDDTLTSPIVYNETAKTITIQTPIVGFFKFTIKVKKQPSDETVDQQREVEVVNYCAGIELDPLVEEYFVRVQQNKKVAGVTVTQIRAENAIVDLFPEPPREECVIKGWYLSSIDSTEQLSLEDPLSKRFMQQLRVNEAIFDMNLAPILVNNTNGLKDTSY